MAGDRPPCNGCDSEDPAGDRMLRDACPRHTDCWCCASEREIREAGQNPPT